MVKVTVIILNYKKLQEARQAILSVKNQVGLEDTEIHIHVTDNNSGDDNTHTLQKEFPENSYLYNTENLGFAKAVNQAIKLNIDSDCFLLLNDDAELAPDCLEQLLTKSNESSITGPVIFYKSKPDIIWQGGGYFNKLKIGVTVPEKNKTLNNKDQAEVDFLSGCVLIIPRKVIEKIGYLDERFFFYGEDLDFCLRAKSANIKIVYVRQAQAWHNIGDITQSRTNPFVLQNLAIAYFLIVNKHFKKLKLYSLFLFIFLYTPFRIFQILKGGGNIKNIQSWIKGGKIGWQTKI